MTPKLYFQRDGITIYLGDCLEILPQLEPVDHILTDPGDLVLDPYAGSLTTAVAAYQLGRRCIAIEREERWCEVGVKRLAQMPLPLEVAR